MITLTVMYPDAPDAYFDMDYYVNKHIAMVNEKCAPAIKACTVEQAAAGGPPAQYRVIARICVDSMDDFLKYVAPHDPEFGADVPNFTNIQPIVQVNEAVL